MSPEVAASYAHCRKIAQTRARNFYYSFVLLDKPRRDAMCALYAFNRQCDDLSDEPAHPGRQSPQDALNNWRHELDAALRGDRPAHPIWPAFEDAVARFRIPHPYFHDMIDGVTSDLMPRRIRTFDELCRYCYQVASAVGLSALHVFGFDSPEAPALAERCGIAFQLTNILRDVREDAEMGRIYLPLEDLEKFDVPVLELRYGRKSKQFMELMRFEVQRARSFYHEAAPLVSMVERRSRGSLWALMRIYSRLLERIEASRYDVLARRIRVPAWEKCWILLRGFPR